MHAQSRMLHPYDEKINVMKNESDDEALTREVAHGDLTEVTYARYRHAKTICVPQKGSQETYILI